jgi:hypothetical protein
MEIIFQIPMRTNNDNTYQSGDRRLGDFIDFAIFDHIGLKIGIESIRAGDSILVSITMLNGAQVFFKYDRLVTDDEVEDIYLDFASGDMTADSFVNGSIHTNGRARYSIDIAALARGEDFPDRPIDEF